MAITKEQVFKTLDKELQKDLIINNPDIVTPGGRQTFDPETNTITLEESGFQKSQRERQEQLAALLSGQLLGGELPSISKASSFGQGLPDVMGAQSLLEGLPSTASDEVRQATFEQGRNLLQPGFEQDRRRLEQSLADQGIPAGSEAYAEAINRLERSQAQQLNQLSLSSVLQGVETGERQRAARLGEKLSQLQTGEAQRAARLGESLSRFNLEESQRSARFNEIASLLGQGQVGGVSFADFQPQASGLDLAGLQEAQRNRAFQAEQARKSRRAARTNALIGAIGGVGSAGITAAFSDARVKENIEIIGESPSGIPIVEFNYKNRSFGDKRYRGVLAQDILKTHPKAVIFNKEYDCYMVDYEQIDVPFREVHNA